MQLPSRTKPTPKADGKCTQALKPIELEIDEMVNKLYGIAAEAEEIEETEEELELIDDLNEEEDDY